MPRERPGARCARSRRRLPACVAASSWKLRWRHVDFAGQAIRVRASFAGGALTTPKSGKVRSVPIALEVAGALAALGRRERWTGDDVLVFVGATGLPRRLGAAPSLHRDAAQSGLWPLRFHDLRHTFGTRMIAKADIRRVHAWIGHGILASIGSVGDAYDTMAESFG